MQEEVRANDAAERSAAEAARKGAPKARAEPLAKATRGGTRTGGLLAIVGIAALIAAGLLWRRHAGERAADWQAAGAASLSPTRGRADALSDVRLGRDTLLPTTVAAPRPHYAGSGQENDQARIGCPRWRQRSPYPSSCK
jgi:hypothetical protein